MYFNFIATDNFDSTAFESVENFVESYPDFQTVVLNDEHELKLLLDQMGIDKFVSYPLKDTGFTKYWDLSDYKLPELNAEKFDSFYHNWIEKSGRDNNMNEYGCLIFLQGLSKKWNALKHRFIIKEDTN